MGKLAMSQNKTSKIYKNLWPLQNFKNYGSSYIPSFLIFPNWCNSSLNIIIHSIIITTFLMYLPLWHQWQRCQKLIYTSKLFYLVLHHEFAILKIQSIKFDFRISNSFSHVSWIDLNILIIVHSPHNVTSTAFSYE